MKKLILMAVATLVVSTVLAQNEKGTFSIKPMAGINVTGFSGGIVEDIYHYKVRFTAGLEAEYACNDWLGVSLGAVYSQQGAKVDGSVAAIGVNEAGQQLYIKAMEKGKLHSDYINLPLMANIYIPVVRGLAVKVGAQVGLLVNDRLEAEVETATIAIPYRSPEGLDLEPADVQNARFTRSSTSISDICKSVDFGIPVGLSYEYKNVTLDARYYFGLTKVDKTKDPDTVRNRYLSITLGYRFHL